MSNPFLKARLGERASNHQEDIDDEKLWHDFFEVLNDHAHSLKQHADRLQEHSKKAHKLAEIVRTVKVTKKVAGRTVPNSTHYVQTVTKRSDTPFK